MMHLADLCIDSANGRTAFGDQFGVGGLFSLGGSLLEGLYAANNMPHGDALC